MPSGGYIGSRMSAARCRIFLEETPADDPLRRMETPHRVQVFWNDHLTHLTFLKGRSLIALSWATVSSSNT